MYICVYLSTVRGRGLCRDPLPPPNTQTNPPTPPPTHKTEALAAAEARLGAQAALISKLEEDLARSTMTTGSDSSSTTTAVVAPEGGKEAGGDGRVDMTQLLLSASVHQAAGPTTQPHDTHGGSLSLVPVLQGQRDRYKARVRELEGEIEAVNAAAARERAVRGGGLRVVSCVLVHGMVGSVGGVQNLYTHIYIYTDPVYIHTRTHQAAEAARRDNVALYEKIRYLQAYSNGCVDII